MTGKWRYGIILLFAIVSGCAGDKQKRIDGRLSLWRLDKIPYGTKYAYDNLAFIFPEADIRTSQDFPHVFEASDTARTLIIISPRFFPDPDEMRAIVRFAARGNQVFISALNIDDSVLHMFHLHSGYKEYQTGDSTTMHVLDPRGNRWLNYQYPGYSRDFYFSAVDSVRTNIFGRDVNGNPNFIGLSYKGGGKIYIHLNPIAFSNFFLLHRQNKLYYDIALSYLPSDSRIVEWSDYFRYSHRPENFSALRFILSSRPLRWAFWLTVGLFLILFLVESKRKQRSIEEKAPKKNVSVDFVKTVGRLYFQQKNNQNLALKMITAFLENIRSKYNLSTSVLDTEFSRKLAHRTGEPPDKISLLLDRIHQVRLNPNLSDQDLMELHLQISHITKLT